MQLVLFLISQNRYCFSEQLEGVYRYARQANWRVQVVERVPGRERMCEIFSYWKPIGVIAEYGDDADLLDKEMTGSVPIVYFDVGRSVPKKGHYIAFDTGAAGRMGAEHLLKLGLSEFAYVGYWEQTAWDDERWSAFSRTILSAGCKCRQFHCIKGRKSSVRMHRMEQWIKSLPRPCGIMAANDRVAEEVLNASLRLKISVPDDFAVLGVDNDRTLGENLTPTLSTVAPLPDWEGYRAAVMLDTLIKFGSDGEEFKSCLVPPEKVVVRQSTRRIAVDMPKVAVALESIRRKAFEGIGVSDVLNEMGVARRTAERFFRQATGHTILEEILRVRFERVYELLAHTNCAIDAIAGQVGYSTEVALRKAFRQREGCSMSTWRKRHASTVR